MKSSFVVAEKMILEAHWSIQVSIVMAAICPLWKMHLHLSIHHSDLDLTSEYNSSVNRAQLISYNNGLLC